MLYSVWQQSSRSYRYFETPEKRETVLPRSPSHIPDKGDMGATPEEAAWPLPADAKEVGSGPYPKGRIAVEKAGPIPRVVWYVLAGIVAWKVFK